MAKIGQFISNPGGFGGAESMAVRLSKTLAEQHGHEVEIYVLSDNTWVHSMADGDNVKVITIPKSIQRHWSIRCLPVLAFKLGKFFKSRELDVLHSHMYPSIIRGAGASTVAGIPHIATLHDTYSVTEKPGRIKWLKCASMLGTKIVAISDEMLNVYTNLGSLTHKDLTVIRNGIDVSKFKYNGNRRGKFTFISTGRLAKIKGYDVLIEAAQFARKDNDFQINIFGDGPERDNLNQLIQQKRLQGIVNLKGSSNEIPMHLGLSDAFVLPSHSEGLSCSIMEAMASELPIIATNVGGNPELVIPGENGSLVTPNDPADLANHILSMKNAGEESLRRMGKTSRKFAAERFSLSNMTMQYNLLYGF